MADDFEIDYPDIYLLEQFIYTDAKDNDSVNSDDEGTLSSRLVQELAKYLLKGIEAKERLIRLRICQLLGHCAYALDSIKFVL